MLTGAAPRFAVTPDGETVRVFHGAGCENCYGTGYHGRVGIFELMELKDRGIPEAARRRSLGKMNRVPSISRTDRLRFLLGYLDAVQAERKDWKPTAQAILQRFRAQVEQ